VPAKRKASLPKADRESTDGPMIPPRHSSRECLNLPPRLPPKSPEPSHIGAADIHRKLSSVEDLLSLHGMSQFTSKLVANGYDDIHFVSDITDEELTEIGITVPAERERLLKIFSAYAA
jgi:hypothetical protein